MRLSRFILTVCLFFSAISCKVQKNKSQSSSQSDSTSISVQSDETITSSTVRRTDSAITATGNHLSRDGLFTIEFDSLTHIDIAASGDIRATGYAPKISSYTSETRRDTTFQSSTAAELSQKDSTGRGESFKSTGEKHSQQEKVKEVTKSLSLIPWIGAGLAVAIAALAVLWFFFRRR